MAKVKAVTMKFPVSGSLDVVGYKMYMEEVPTAVSDASESYSLDCIIEDGIAPVDLSTVPGMTSKDGVYNFGIVAVDDADNESSFTLINDVPIDFIAPDPVGDIEIVRE